MFLTCFQCQGPSLHLQCQQVCSWTPTRFVSVNVACSWTSLHLSFMNVTMGFENRRYLLLSDVLYNSSTWTFMACIALPLTTLSSLKVLLEILSLGYCSGIKNWQDTDTLWLTPLGRSAWGPQLYARQVLVQGICSQAPAMGAYLWSGAIREMERQIQLFFSSWNIFLLCLTILSEVSLHSDFKFRQIHQWLLKRSVHCKTRLSCSDTPSHLLWHAQPCF